MEKLHYAIWNKQNSGCEFGWFCPEDGLLVLCDEQETEADCHSLEEALKIVYEFENGGNSASFPFWLERCVYVDFCLL